MWGVEGEGEGEEGGGGGVIKVSQKLQCTVLHTVKMFPNSVDHLTLLKKITIRPTCIITGFLEFFGNMHYATVHNSILVSDLSLTGTE